MNTLPETDKTVLNDDIITGNWISYKYIMS